MLGHVSLVFVCMCVCGAHCCMYFCGVHRKQMEIMEARNQGTHDLISRSGQFSSILWSNVLLICWALCYSDAQQPVTPKGGGADHANTTPASGAISSAYKLPSIYTANFPKGWHTWECSNPHTRLFVFHQSSTCTSTGISPDNLIHVACNFEVFSLETIMSKYTTVLRITLKFSSWTSVPSAVPETVDFKRLKPQLVQRTTVPQTVCF